MSRENDPTLWGREGDHGPEHAARVKKHRQEERKRKRRQKIATVIAVIFGTALVFVGTVAWSADKQAADLARQADEQAQIARKTARDRCLSSLRFGPVLASDRGETFIEFYGREKGLREYRAYLASFPKSCP